MRWTWRLGRVVLLLQGIRKEEAGRTGRRQFQRQTVALATVDVLVKVSGSISSVLGFLGKRMYSSKRLVSYFSGRIVGLGRNIL